MAKSDEHEVTYDRDSELIQAIKYLESLAASLRSGTVCVEQGVLNLTVYPPDDVRLKIRVRKTRTKESVSFELGWERDAEKDPTGEFKITGGDDQPTPELE